MTDSSTSPTSVFLCTEFAQVIRQLNGVDTSITSWSYSLITAYTESQRHYHTLVHISSMLQLFQKYCNLIARPLVVQLAIFFHDWVYDPKAHDNELQSISVFKTFAAEVNLEESLIESVCRCIEATITHSLNERVRDNKDLKLFLDFDLEVLGRGEEEYEVYAGQIRKEYAHLGEREYAQGRLGVLEKFLARERLYLSEALGAELEVRARENLKTEIAGLKASLL